MSVSSRGPGPRCHAPSLAGASRTLVDSLPQPDDHDHQVGEVARPPGPHAGQGPAANAGTTANSISASVRRPGRPCRARPSPATTAAAAATATARTPRVAARPIELGTADRRRCASVPWRARPAGELPRRCRDPRRLAPSVTSASQGARAILGARAAVAQLARASACHAEGRGFESLQPLVTKAPLLAGFFFVRTARTGGDLARATTRRYQSKPGAHPRRPAPCSVRTRLQRRPRGLV